MTQTTLGRVLCAIGLHKWIYNIAYWVGDDKGQHERHCNRCHAHHWKPYGLVWQRHYMSGYSLPEGEVRNP